MEIKVLGDEDGKDDDEEGLDMLARVFVQMKSVV